MKKIFLILCMFLLSGCALQEIPLANQTSLPDPYYCEKDADCVVKDVHNCCGYYPKCVNVDYTPDIEAVQKECSEKGMVGICGFPDITSCRCVANKCESVQGQPDSIKCNF